VESRKGEEKAGGCVLRVEAGVGYLAHRMSVETGRLSCPAAKRALTSTWCPWLSAVTHFSAAHLLPWCKTHTAILQLVRVMSAVCCAAPAFEGAQE